MAEDTMYLTVNENPDGPGLIAVITMGQPQLGDKCVVVLDVTIVPDIAAADAWYEREKIEKPWETRQ